MQVSALQKKLLNERSCTFPTKTVGVFVYRICLVDRTTLSNISSLDEILEMRLLIELDNSFIIDGG